jgi:hypothetical protein
METDLQQDDRPIACVIVQNYSSAKLVSLGFHSRKEKFDGFSKI